MRGVVCGIRGGAMQRARCGWMGVDARGKAQPLDESIELGGLHRARSMVAFATHSDVGAGRSSLTAWHVFTNVVECL